MSIGAKLFGALKIGEKVLNTIPTGVKVAGHVASGMTGNINVGDAVADVKKLAHGISEVVGEVSNVVNDLS